MKFVKKEKSWSSELGIQQRRELGFCMQKKRISQRTFLLLLLLVALGLELGLPCLGRHGSRANRAATTSLAIPILNSQ